tara:strand:+ start:208 stop:921 length:714 start_codon:yes stop_codon:yes gene_type:complete
VQIKNNDMNKFSIIIPILNEKKNILLLIKKIKESLKKKTYEIIIIDDNSYDGSMKILKILKKKEKNFYFYIRKKKTRDLSKSVLLGVEKSKYSNLLIMDGDMQHNPKYLPILFEIFIKRKLDVLIAARDFSKRSGLTFIRYFLSLFIIIVINTIFKKKTSDPMSGFFVIKKKIFIENKENLYSKGFKILFDVIYSSKKNLRIQDYKIKFVSRKNNKSKMNFKILLHIVLIILQKKIF